MMNPRLPCYQRMLVAAGYPEATEGVWNDAMTDGAVKWGGEFRAAESIAELFPSAPPNCWRRPSPPAPAKPHPLTAPCGSWARRRGRSARERGSVNDAGPGRTTVRPTIFTLALNE